MAALLRRTREVLAAPKLQTVLATAKTRFASGLAVPPVTNEASPSFSEGSPEWEDLQNEIKLRKENPVEIPVVIRGKCHFTGDIVQQTMPSDHGIVLANVHQATEELVKEAIEVVREARNHWEKIPFTHRAAVFLKAADLISTTHRSKVLASNMLGQSKTLYQGEIDSTCETIDFLRFGVKYATEMYNTQPDIHSRFVWNRLEYRALEGFVAAIAPFNFTAIGANLAGLPALLGNGVLWKPSNTAALSNYAVYQAFLEAGLPEDIISFIPAAPEVIGPAMLGSEHLAAVNFTGSTGTFNRIWKDVAQNVENYKTYPRLIGECGGKNFHVVHESADIDNAVYATIRSAFEYQGQKCSACSRAYIPKSMWPEFKKKLVDSVNNIKVGQPDDRESFMAAVIDKPAFDKISGFIERAKARDSCDLLAGGKSDDSTGYFVSPTVFEVKDPKDELLEQEIFGPVLAVHVYDDSDWSSALKLVNETSPYGLTGAIFAKSRTALEEAQTALSDSCGNLYLNDKSTGAVVGQQPFGGARRSGTNDKAGASQYLLRFTSVQTQKEHLSSYESMYDPFIKH